MSWKPADKVVVVLHLCLRAATNLTVTREEGAPLACTRSKPIVARAAARVQPKLAIRPFHRLRYATRQVARRDCHVAGEREALCAKDKRH